MDILMYAPLGNNIPKERIGGAEIGCLRSIDMIKESGINISIIEKPTTYYGIKKFIKEFRVAYKQIKSELTSNKNSIFYLVGFYDRQIYFEALLCWLAKRTKHEIIYEPKNGAMVYKYKNGSEIYKKLSKFIFKNARIIFCQGIEYKEFLNEIGFKNAIYHPNYIKKENSLLINRKDNELFKFVYLGRVTKSKNIEFVIDVFEKVHSKIPGSVLYIIGGWDEDYKIELENRIKNANIENEAYFTGRLDFRGIAEELNTSHFFLFPSQNKFEGHSNALTEAMAFGLVPITSNYGFNKTVVGYKELVIEDFVVEKYAETAINIITQGLWDEYSKKMMKRVEDNFSEEVVRENYIRSLKQLLYNSEKSMK